MTALTPVESVPAFAVIIRATHERGADARPARDYPSGESDDPRNCAAGRRAAPNLKL